MSNLARTMRAAGWRVADDWRQAERSGEQYDFYIKLGCLVPLHARARRALIAQCDTTQQHHAILREHFTSLRR